MIRRTSNILTLAPASKLPLMDEWRWIANCLPIGSVLLIAPDGETGASDSMRRVAAAFRRHGRKVLMISAFD